MNSILSRYVTETRNAPELRRLQGLDPSASALEPHLFQRPRLVWTPATDGGAATKVRKSPRLGPGCDRLQLDFRGCSSEQTLQRQDP